MQPLRRLFEAVQTAPHDVVCELHKLPRLRPAQWTRVLDCAFGRSSQLDIRTQNEILCRWAAECDHTKMRPRFAYWNISADAFEWFCKATYIRFQPRTRGIRRWLKLRLAPHQWNQLEHFGGFNAYLLRFIEVVPRLTRELFDLVVNEWWTYRIDIQEALATRAMEAVNEETATQSWAEEGVLTGRINHVFRKPVNPRTFSVAQLLFLMQHCNHPIFADDPGTPGWMVLELYPVRLLELNPMMFDLQKTWISRAPTYGAVESRCLDTPIPQLQRRFMAELVVAALICVDEYLVVRFGNQSADRRAVDCALFFRILKRLPPELQWAIAEIAANGRMIGPPRHAAFAWVLAAQGKKEV